MEKAEFIRRVNALGIANKSVAFNLGRNAFVPADPDAAPIHAGGRLTSDYVGGLYTAEGDFVPDCREQFCAGVCEMCERNARVMVRGVAR